MSTLPRRSVRWGGPEADSAAGAEAAVGDEDAEVRLAAVSSLGQLAFAADAPLARIAEGSDAGLAAIARRFLANRPAQEE